MYAAYGKCIVKPPTPGLVLRTELQNYFREARSRLEVNIYQCECWGTDGQYYTIPFFQRAVLGVQAYARAIQVCSNKPTLNCSKSKEEEQMFILLTNAL